eukprot:13660742-Alexandrium_andersonii.AAC.1
MSIAPGGPRFRLKPERAEQWHQKSSLSVRPDGMTSWNPPRIPSTALPSKLPEPARCLKDPQNLSEPYTRGPEVF